MVKPSVRLYVIMAREASRAIVFRRGPSKQVLLILWDTDNDTFVEGQWLKGHIYERRCDLAPSGKRLLYFAANFKEPYFSWSAVSKPPFLTAVAMWPKGDCWGGGGLFVKENEILLNHRENEMRLTECSQLPATVSVKPLEKGSGWGEDSPLLDMRLERDGWTITQEGKCIENTGGAPVKYQFDPPLIWSKPHPQKAHIEINESIFGFCEPNGPWYVTEHKIYDKEVNKIISLGKTDWADWSRTGDLLFAKNGKIFRLGMTEHNDFNIENAKLLIDLTNRIFVARESPQEAKLWD